MQQKKLKIGLVGVGHLGKIHLNCIQQILELELSGIFDIDVDEKNRVAQQFKVNSFNTYEELLAASDAVDIVSSTSSHFQLAKSAISNNKHCFIEKPVTSTLEEALELKNLLANHPVNVQIGHVERFNPSFAAIREFIKQPKFIEAHRLSSFNPRGRAPSLMSQV